MELILWFFGFVVVAFLGYWFKKYVDEEIRASNELTFGPNFKAPVSIARRVILVELGGKLYPFTFKSYGDAMDYIRDDRNRAGGRVLSFVEETSEDATKRGLQDKRR